MPAPLQKKGDAVADELGEAVLVLHDLAGDLEDLRRVALGGDEGELAAEHTAEVDAVGLHLDGDHDQSWRPIWRRRWWR
jgi:hypothetical protein